MGTRVNVANLSRGTTTDGLRRACHARGYEIRNVRLTSSLASGEARGVAYVELADDASAEEAIATLDGMLLDGCRLHVAVAGASGAHKLCIDDILQAPADALFAARAGGVPNALRARAFVAWCAGDPQTATAELCAEHHLIFGVLDSMLAEVRELGFGSPLRQSFWALALEFNNDFVHACHRVKEEAHWMPVVTRRELLDEKDLSEIQREHRRANRLTAALQESVERGDWESALRTVVQHDHFLRPHMEQEERGFLRVARAGLTPEDAERLHRAFAEVEREALGEGGRRHYVELARRMRRTADVDSLGSIDPGI